MTRPVLTVIAWPNGSGKSTLTQKLISRGVDFGHYINADEIELGLGHITDPQLRSREAQNLAVAERADCLAKKRDFAFETVMSHPSKIELMNLARSLGYHVVLYFVALDNPELNVARVDLRVARGGHPVPKERIIARYHRTLALLPSAILASDRVVFFDNTYSNLFDLRAIAEVKRAGSFFNSTVVDHNCSWLNSSLLQHLPFQGLKSGFTQTAAIPASIMEKAANDCISGMTFP